MDSGTVNVTSEVSLCNCALKLEEMRKYVALIIELSMSVLFTFFWVAYYLILFQWRCKGMQIQLKVVNLTLKYINV